MRWFLGLFSTIYVWFLSSLALSTGIAAWAQSSTRVNPEGFLAVTPASFGLAYLIFSFARLSDGEINLFWTHRPISEMLIWFSIGIIGVVEFLFSQPGFEITFQVIRDSYYLPTFSQPLMFYGLCAVLLGGYFLHHLHHRFYNLQVDVQDPIIPRFSVTPRRLLNIVLVLGFFYFLTLSYAVHVGFQNFVIESTNILLKGDIELFRDYLLSFGAWAPLVSGFLMIFVLVVAPPLPAFVVTFTNGLLFGAVWGTLLSWSSAMVGAAMSFYISRALGRPVVEKLFPDRALDWTDHFFREYGVHSVLVARLIPVVSFALVSYGAGLTAMGFLGFFIATGIGQLPATIVYSWLGEHAAGSIMYVFWTFVVVIAMVVIGAGFRGWLKSSFLKPEKA